MVDFSRHFHSEEKKQENIKNRYPKLKSISLNSSDFHNFSENQNFITPRISNYNSGITDERLEKCTSTRELNRNFNSFCDINFVNYSPLSLNDKEIKSSKTWLSFDNNKENEIVPFKKRLKLKIRNLYNRNMNECFKGGRTSNHNSNNNYFYNNEDKSKTSRLLKTVKPNCYYNNLHLLKLSKMSKKNSYQNLD